MSLFPMYDEKRDYSGVMQATAAAARRQPVAQVSDDDVADALQTVEDLYHMLLTVETKRDNNIGYFTPLQLGKLIGNLINENDTSAYRRLRTFLTGDVTSEVLCKKIRDLVPGWKAGIGNNASGKKHASDARMNSPKVVAFVSTVRNKLDGGKRLDAAERAFVSAVGY